MYVLSSTTIFKRMGESILPTILQTIISFNNSNFPEMKPFNQVPIIFRL